MMNMRTLTREELKRLMEWRGGLCVSVFMPTHRVGPKDLEQDPIRLKNLLREAENQLVGHGMRAAEGSDDAGSGGSSV